MTGEQWQEAGCEQELAQLCELLTKKLKVVEGLAARRSCGCAPGREVT